MAPPPKPAQDRIEAPEVYDNFRFDPASSTTVPKVTSAEALASIHRLGLYPGIEKATSQPPTSKFGLFTDSTYGELDANGHLSETYVKRPVWAIIYTGLPAEPAYLLGGASLNSTTLPPVTRPADVTETVIIVVDSETGQPLLGKTISVPK